VRCDVVNTASRGALIKRGAALWHSGQIDGSLLRAIGRSSLNSQLHAEQRNS